MSDKQKKDEQVMSALVEMMNSVIFTALCYANSSEVGVAAMEERTTREVHACFDGVRGNRSRDSMASGHDIKLAYIAVLRRAIEIAEGKP